MDAPAPNPDLLQYDNLVRKLAVSFGADSRWPEDSWQYSEGWIALVLAHRRYELGRHKAHCLAVGREVDIENFLGVCICYRLRHEMQKLKRVKRGGRVRTICLSDLGGNLSWDHLAVRTNKHTSFPDDEVIGADEVKRLLRHLDTRYRRLVERVVLEGYTLTEVGQLETPPISRPRVQQILDKAFGKLRRVMLGDPSVP